MTRDGNEVGWDQRMGCSSPPYMVLSCLIPAPLHMTKKTFSTHPRPLEPHEAPPHLIKFYFLLIFPTTSTNFFYETYFINTNILEITTKFIPSNQINFLKKLNNISKCLTRQSQQQQPKKKSHSITHNKIKAKNHIW